jgi:trk system potassium uptake protein TrkA
MNCPKRWTAASCKAMAAGPNILREVNPEQTDFLFCLTDSDQANVIASLVGRSLGFKRVVTSIRRSAIRGHLPRVGV